MCAAFGTSHTLFHHAEGKGKKLAMPPSPGRVPSGGVPGRCAPGHEERRDDASATGRDISPLYLSPYLDHGGHVARHGDGRLVLGHPAVGG